jgi:hypothetical protein
MEISDKARAQAAYPPFEPLPDNKHYIRVFHISQGGKEDPIQCKLPIRRLDDSSPYFCLSYIWDGELSK